jgi:predicted peptidase
MIGLAIWIFNSLTAIVDGYGLKALQWSPLFENFALTLFVIHFVKERKHVEVVKSQSQRLVGYLMVGLLTTGLIVFFLLGLKTGKDIAQIVRHTEPATNNQQKLARRFEEGVISSEDKKLLYRLLYPIDYDPTIKYPLVICLHGSSGRGVGNVRQVSSSLMATNLSTPKNRKKYPAFLFVPQCAPNAEWGGLGHLPEYNPLVLKAIDSLEKELPVDATRRYLTGYSMGGYGVWDLIGNYPTMFAAAVPMCGAGDPRLAQNMVDVPIWAFHGAKDRNVLVRGSRDVIKAIEDAGGNPLYTEYKDKTHNIWENISKEPDLLPWLFSKVKN